jgi:hypothetical protein
MNQKLSLKQHCIETELKRRYNKAISDYFKAEFKGREDLKTHLETSIDIFQSALDNFDFGHLRNRYPDLRGNSDAAVMIYRDGSHRLRITINGEDIEP